MTDTEQTGTSARMLELATEVEQCLLYKGVPGLGVFRMHEADQKLIVAALRTAASQDAREVLKQITSTGSFEEVQRIAHASLSSIPQSAPALSPSQQAERLPSSDAAEAGADAVALAGKIETIDRLFAREEYDADSAALSLMRDIWDDLKSAALAAPQPQAEASEPVAWIVLTKDGSMLRIWWRNKIPAEAWSKQHNLPLIPLYAAPLPAASILALATPSPTTAGRK